VSDQMEIGTLLGDDTPATPRVTTPHRVDVIARFLAGFGFPDRHSYEKLTKKQRATAIAAAEAALTVFDNHQED
jgi:hypothetical protein